MINRKSNKVLEFRSLTDQGFCSRFTKDNDHLGAYFVDLLIDVGLANINVRFFLRCFFVRKAFDEVGEVDLFALESTFA